MGQREFLLPDIGAGMVEAEVVAWRVEIGQSVEVDQPLVDIETEKSVAEIPVPFAGKIVRLGVAEGETIEVGSMLAIIEVSDEESSEPAKHSAPRESEENGGEPTPEAVEGSSSSARAPRGPRRRAMPVARKMAEVHGIALDALEGTGPGGAVTRDDVQRAIDGAQAPTESAPTGGEAPSTGDPRQRMSKLRRTIAERMHASWREAPHISGHTEVTADRLLARRAQLADEHGLAIPLEAVVIQAVIPVLLEFPAIHAWVDREDLVSYRRMDIGVAVDTPQGLLVPVVHGADRLSIVGLAERIHELSERAGQHELTPAEMAGNTFTISNLGPFISAHATQVLAPRTTGILSLGRARKAPIAKGDAIGIAQVMPLSASFDHRAVDGAVGARFLAALRDRLEAL